MNKGIIKTIILTVILFMSEWSFGQGEMIEVKDLETWSSLNLKYKIDEKWDIALQGQLRLDNNSSEVSQYFGQLELGYSPFKHFEFGGALRYIKKNDNTGAIQGYEDHFRYHLDGVFKHKKNNFKFKYRARYQNKNELGSDDVAKKYFRFKAGIDYNIRKWKFDPELSGELFRPLGSESDNQLDGYRLTLGTSFKVYKSSKIGIYYRYEKELNTGYPKTTNIIRLKYTHILK